MSVALAHGDVVAKRYRLLAPLGRGGMGVVWSAEHLVLGRSVAVKFVTRGNSDNLRRAQRFLSEAKVAAAVQHPNVVDILDFGVSELGQPYMVMELLEGMSLRERLAVKPALSVEQLLDHMDGVLAGLTAVHDAGLVHRDLKPENVFLAEHAGGVTPKVLDFGLSRVAQGERVSHDSVTMTQEDQILGTPLFMAPEQVRQLDDLDARTDVWGIGVLLYTALTGLLPFDAPKVVDLLFEITRGEEPHSVASLRPEIGGPVSDVVARAMSRDRAKRYASAQELRTALKEAREKSGGALIAPAHPMPLSQRREDAAAGGSTGLSQPPEILTLASESSDQSGERSVPPPARPRWSVVIAAALLVLAGAWTWWWTNLFNPSPSVAPAPVPAGPEVSAPPAPEVAPPAPAGKVRKRALGPSRPRKGGAANKAPVEKDADRKKPPTLFKNPDY